MTEVFVGLGLSSAATTEEVLALLDDVLAIAGRTRADVVAVATIDTRAAHPALAALAHPVVTFPADVLDAIEVPHPSTAVADRVGTSSVAEAAALLAAAAHVERPTLLVPKTASPRATAAVAG